MTNIEFPRLLHSYKDKVCINCGIKKQNIGQGNDRKAAYSFDEFKTWVYHAPKCVPGDKKKLCRICNTRKNISDFANDRSRKSGITSNCKSCRVYRFKKWLRRNPEKAKIYDSKKKLKDGYREKCRISRRKRDKINNTVYKFFFNIRRKSTSIIRQQTGKRGNKIKYIGCTRQEFINHLEAKFKPGMTWDNYGSVWEVDHIIPLASAGKLDKNRIIELAHYTNTQPLFREENVKKYFTHDRYII